MRSVKRLNFWIRLLMVNISTWEITIERIFYLSLFSSSPELSDLKTLQTREAKNKSTNVRLKQHNLWYCLISEWCQVYLYVEKRHIVETLAQSSEKVRVRRESRRRVRNDSRIKQQIVVSLLVNLKIVSMGWLCMSNTPRWVEAGKGWRKYTQFQCEWLDAHCFSLHQ